MTNSMAGLSLDSHVTLLQSVCVTRLRHGKLTCPPKKTFLLQYQHHNVNMNIGSAPVVCLMLRLYVCAGVWVVLVYVGGLRGVVKDLWDTNKESLATFCS